MRRFTIRLVLAHLWRLASDTGAGGEIRSGTTHNSAVEPLGYPMNDRRRKLYEKAKAKLEADRLAADANTQEAKPADPAADRPSRLSPEISGDNATHKSGTEGT